MTPNAILEFILDLLRDHEAAVGYRTDPSESLRAAGLTTVTPEDIAAVAPMVAESALVGGGSQLVSIVAAGPHEGFGADSSLCTPPTDTAATWSGVDVSHAFGDDIDTGGYAGAGLFGDESGHAATVTGTHTADDVM